MNFLKIHLILPIKCNNILIISFKVVIYQEKYKIRKKSDIAFFFRIIAAN